MLRFSNFLFPESRDPAGDQRVIAESVAEAKLCDELGVEVLWLAEHHFDGNCAYVDPVTFAAAVLSATKRIKVGFAVAQVSLHHPMRLAEQMSLLDNLSGGRVIVGLGRGRPTTSMNTRAMASRRKKRWNVMKKPKASCCRPGPARMVFSIRASSGI
jgi:alkanesulfonate monooxygenase SsuD/methylene tetrahydromethanopterin reductase-like flavin-dependent oxidoreductase (luciferase family)